LKRVRLSHKSTSTVLAEGPIGWGTTPFEGNFYIRRKHLTTHDLRPNVWPGLCSYKFLYVWLDLHLGDGQRIRNLEWL
jgi:hypothetical protein